MRRISLMAVLVFILAAGVLLDKASVIGEQQEPAVQAVAVLAGGCFWGVESVFEHVKGVRSVTSGYARETNASGVVPAESVRIVYDPSQLTYQDLLDVFFFVAHDPTTKDRQGPDSGPEYRAVVFYQSPPERTMAEQYVADITRARRFGRPIMTVVRPLQDFAAAEPLHQDYSFLHPADAYVVRNDVPKLAQLQRRYPALYQRQRAP